MNEEHPVALVVDDDLRRSRLTVFFRLILAIPHYIWFFFWSIGIFVAAIVGWVVTLVTGQLPGGLHRFFSAYIRYSTYLFSYLYLTANPYPPFIGNHPPFGGSPSDTYPVDVTLPDPARQRRWTVLIRIILAIPAVTVSGLLGGGLGSGSLLFTRSGNSRMSSGDYPVFSGLMAGIGAFLGWFVCLVRGEMPRGFRDTGAYGVGYRAHAYAYLLLVTERYPNSDPHKLLARIDPPPVHPVHLEGDALDLRRSRLTVFFRLPLLVPHLVWLYLWSLLVGLAIIVQWFVLLFTGRPSRELHRFISSFIRYAFHVYAFGSIAANPFPGFVGKPGVYPLDLALPEPGRQNRWKTFFRGPLAIPAFIFSFGLWVTLVFVSVLLWFTALITAKAPEGLRNLAAWCLRYLGQTYAFYYLVTDVYPHSSPLEGAEPAPEPVAVPEALSAA